jgi:hypothetical protein
MNTLHELYQRDRHQDFIEQAEQTRFIAAHVGPRKPVYQAALNALGAQLVTLGNRLQDNANAAPPTPLRPANDCV